MAEAIYHGMRKSLAHGLNRGLFGFHRIEKTISMVLIHAMALLPNIVDARLPDEIIPTKKSLFSLKRDFFVILS